KGNCLYQLRDKDQAVTFFEKALEYADTSDTGRYSDVLNNLGAMYLSIGRIDSGLFYLGEAKRLDSLNQDYIRITDYYINMAQFNHQRHRTDEAIRDALIALGYTERVKNPDNVMLRLYSNLCTY